MFVLLAICLVLHPQRIDEILLTTLKDKSYSEKMNKMQHGELSEFEAGPDAEQSWSGLESGKLLQLRFGSY